ncbi:MAG: aminotransferase class IV, partial [Rhabdochlamydiaceae bacterium]
LVRLKRSADLLELSLPYSFQEIEAIIEEILGKTKFPETSLKLILTGGRSSNQFTLEGAPTFCVMAYPHKPFPIRQFKEGIAVCTTRHLRPFPQAKSTCYLTALAAMKQAKLQGADDVLYVNGHNEILEALTSNIFVVKQGKLITPLSDEILPGITREVLRRCAAPDIEVEIASLPFSELKSWDEVFMTSSSREVMPVVSIDNKPIGNGKVGPMSLEMLRRFKAYTETEDWTPFDNLNNLIDTPCKYI